MTVSRLFRHAPLPGGLAVFDAHVNALPPGVAAPDSFYSAVGLDAVVAAPGGRGESDPPIGPGGPGSEGPDTTLSGAMSGLDFVGGCVAPPAGVDLLDASLRLRDACLAHEGWHALLRLDAGTGPRPPRGTPGRIAARLGLDGKGGGKGGKEGGVGSAILEDPSILGGFAGIKLMPQQTGLPGPDVLACLRASGLPVLVHAGIQCPPRWLETHLLPWLDAPVVFAHLASWPCAADDLEYALALAAADPRVHFETSGASIGNFVRVAAESVPERLLFGSNRPMCAAAVQLMHVAASIDDDAALRAVASGNAHRVFGTSAGAIA